MFSVSASLSLYFILIAIIIPSCFGNPTHSDYAVDDSLIFIMMSCASAVQFGTDMINHRSRYRRFVTRDRRCVSDIFSDLGPYFVRRSYRMTEEEFWKLFNLIEPFYPKEKKNCKRKRRWKNDCAPNKKIQKSLRLSAAIRYYASGCPLDIMSSHGIGYNDVYNSVWSIMDAINSCPKLRIEFPTSHEERKITAANFNKKSSVDFDNCVGCINAMLIWTSKPSSPGLLEAKVGCKKVFCGQKNCLD